MTETMAVNRVTAGSVASALLAGIMAMEAVPTKRKTHF